MLKNENYGFLVCHKVLDIGRSVATPCFTPNVIIRRLFIRQLLDV